MRFAIIGLLLLVLSACVEEYREQPSGNDLSGKVIHVKDGDSFVMLHESKNKIEVRLIDIDAPELHQAYGRKAKQYLSGLIKGKRISLDYEKKDRYNRVLAYAYLDTLNVNEEMIRAGYAWHFTRFSSDRFLQSLEDNAKDAHKGLWQDKKPQAPWEWRDENRK